MEIRLAKVLIFLALLGIVISNDCLRGVTEEECGSEDSRSLSKAYAAKPKSNPKPKSKPKGVGVPSARPSKTPSNMPVLAPTPVPVPTLILNQVPSALMYCTLPCPCVNECLINWPLYNADTVACGLNCPCIQVCSEYLPQLSMSQASGLVRDKIILGWIGAYPAEVINGEPKGIPPPNIQSQVLLPLAGSKGNNKFWFAVAFVPQDTQPIGSGIWKFDTTDPPGNCGTCGIEIEQCLTCAQSPGLSCSCLISLLGGDKILAAPTVDDNTYISNSISSIIAIVTKYKAIGVEINIENWDAGWTDQKFSTLYCGILRGLINKDLKIVISPFSATKNRYLSLYNNCPEAITYTAYQCYADRPADQQTCINGVANQFGGQGKQLLGLCANKYDFRGTGSVANAAQLFQNNPNFVGIGMWTWENDVSNALSMTKSILNSAPAPPPPPSCFARDSYIPLANGDKALISSVRIGDSIMAADSKGNMVIADIILISHPENQIESEFVHLVTSSGKGLKLTRNHLLLVFDPPESSQAAPLESICEQGYDTNGGDNVHFALQEAQKVTIGMCVKTATGAETVLSVERVYDRGVYSLATAEEYIVVNEIIASPFACNHVAFSSIIKMLHFINPMLIQTEWSFRDQLAHVVYNTVASVTTVHDRIFNNDFFKAR